MTKVSGALAILFISLIATSSKSAELPEESSKSLLKIGGQKSYSVKNPMSFFSDRPFFIDHLIFRPLVFIDQNLKWQCGLCESIPTLKNGLLKTRKRKGREFLESTWKVKKSIFWSDGSAVTARDVKFSVILARVLAKEKGLPEPWPQIDFIEIDSKDKRKFKLVSMGLDSDFYQLNSLFVVPHSIEEKIWLNSGENIDTYLTNSSYASNNFDKMLFNGPFIVKTSSENFTTFVRNPHFKDPIAKFSTVEYRSVANETTLKNHILEGDYDFVSDLELPLRDFFELEQRLSVHHDHQTVMRFVENHFFENITFNLRNTLLAEKALRTALIFATNRDEIVSKIFYEKWEKADSPFHKGESQELKNMPRYRYAPELANDLLNRLGWVLGEGGFRKKDAALLEFELVIPDDDEIRKLIATTIKKQWLKVGIDLKVIRVTRSVYNDKVIAKGHFRDLVLIAWEFLAGSYRQAVFHSKEIPTFENNYQGQNIGAWRNQGIDEALFQLSLEYDKEKQKSLLADMQKIYAEDLPSIPLYFHSDVWVYSSRLKNVGPTDNLDLDLSKPESWEFKD